MKRSFLVGLAAAGALFGAAGAQAKAPPDGIDICGVRGVCVHLAVSDAEGEWSLWGTAGYAVPASGASSFYVLRWHWPRAPQQTAYYVPAAGKVRQVDGQRGALWYDLHEPKALRARIATLDAFPLPRLTRVTVGNRSVRDPQSYFRLFGRGSQVWPVREPGWLRVVVTAGAPSPWTDAATDVRVSRRGAYLWIDGSILKIPLQLAQRIRRGVSLRG
jgi:hypothetical protein